LAVDVSPWLRPDAATSDDRCFCHTYGRGKGNAQLIPGWPYSFVAALGSGATSWCALLDVQRLGRDDDATAVTAGQVRDMVGRLATAGQHRPGDPDILIVFDAGYDICRLTWLLADLPVHLLGRVRSDRVFCFPAARRARAGRPPRHGPVFTSPTPRPIPRPRCRPVPTPPATAPPEPRPDRGCIPGSSIKAAGPIIPASCRSPLAA
jgi:hypothetical protein